MLYAVLAALIVVAVVGAAYALTVDFRTPSGASATVLVTAGTLYSIPVSQFNGISFVAGSPSTLNGTFSESYGLQLYTMNATQYQHLITKGTLDGYEWTSGALANDTIYNLEVTVPAGTWVLVFANPNAPESLITTSVGFYTDLTLTR